MLLEPLPKSKTFDVAVNFSEKRGGLLTRKALSPSDFAPLPDAVQEIEEIAKGFRSSELFVNQEASIIDALSEASKLVLKEKQAAIVLATHGVAVDYEEGYQFRSINCLRRKIRFCLIYRDIFF